MIKCKKHIRGVNKMIIKNGLIHDAVNEEAYISDIKNHSYIRYEGVFKYGEVTNNSLRRSY